MGDKVEGQMEMMERARAIADSYGISLTYVSVCPDHGAMGPFASEQEAQEQVDYLNATSTGCTYKVLPLFPGS